VLCVCRPNYTCYAPEGRYRRVPHSVHCTKDRKCNVNDYYTWNKWFNKQTCLYCLKELSRCRYIWSQRQYQVLNASSVLVTAFEQPWGCLVNWLVAQAPETIRACPGVYRVCLTSYSYMERQLNDLNAYHHFILLQYLKIRQTVSTKHCTDMIWYLFTAVGFPPGGTGR